MKSRSAKFLLLIVLTFAFTAHAAVDSWTASGGGTYSAGGNWSAGAMPGPSDQALFALDSTYSVGFTANATANQLLVDSGEATFNLGGKTATFTSGSFVDEFQAIAVAQSFGSAATLNLSNGTLTARAGSVGAHNQNALGGTGVLNILSGATLVMQGNTFDNTLWVGNDATGVLNVTGGSALFDDLSLANGRSDGTTSNGAVNVKGAGSSISLTEVLSLGDHPGGTATMLVKDSGFVTTNQLYVGYGGSGDLTVDAATVDAHFLVPGYATEGTVTIQNGATFNAVDNFLGHAQISIGFRGGSGLLTIKDGSTLTDTGTFTIGVTAPLNPGGHSTGQFRVIGGNNSIQINGNLMMGVDAPSIAEVIDSTGISVISVGGSASLTGDLYVQLSDVTPAPGEIYTVLTAVNGITGSLTLAGPDANNFQMTQVGNSLELIYTPAPEPTSLALIGCAMIPLLSRPRRRHIALCECADPLRA